MYIFKYRPKIRQCDFLVCSFVWLFGFYDISTFVGYVMPNLFYTNSQFYLKQFSLAWVQSLIVKNTSISSNTVLSNSCNLSNSSYFEHSFCPHTVKTLLFQAIQFNISTMISPIWPIDKTLSGATTLGQIEPESDGNKEVLCIPQSSSITRKSPSDCLVSYPRHLLGESYPSAEKQSVYSTASTNWERFGLVSLLNGISIFVGYLMPKPSI